VCVCVCVCVHLDMLSSGSHKLNDKKIRRILGISYFLENGQAHTYVIGLKSSYVTCKMMYFKPIVAHMLR